jgi:protein-S-isoprenylcysteine O-methyltransferase Ste14
MQHLIEYRPPRIAMSLVLIASAMHLLVGVSMHTGLPAAAAVVFIMGLALMIRAWWLFKQVGTAICPTEQSSTLVTHDVFAVTRNPMSLGIILMICAAGVWTGSLHFYVVAIAFALIIDRVFCPYEEQKAVGAFGDQYLAYQQRVRRWL